MSIDLDGRWQAHRLAVAASLIRDCLGPVVAAAAQLIVVSDADGTICGSTGPEGVRLDAAETMNIVEGADWSEVVQEWTCPGRAGP